MWYGDCVFYWPSYYIDKIDDDWFQRRYSCLHPYGLSNCYDAL